ncbi:CstA-like transporter-associated (seleno)protein [Nocardioides solisilvae]|uniref:CstA-like transporter-associated (seleno)protein n=1 Tax=Nocardioides solisilvae TaxID=1542435 RepID=UPI000D7481AD|nr:CstA-like transporter-associated (seleno)protein [Nocardioides solisilvae]
MTVAEAALGRVRGVRRFVRAFTGEAKWDEYVEACRRSGVAPVSRREFERHRAEHQERSARSRCC